MKIQYKNEFDLPAGANVDQLARKLNEEENRFIVAYESNSEIKNLSESLEENGTIKFVSRTCDCGQRILERSLIFIFLAAVKDILPDKEVIVEHSLSGGIYTIIQDNKANSYLKKDIISRMKHYIENDDPIIKRMFPKEEVKEYFKGKKYFDKYSILDYQNDDFVPMYELGKVKETFYGELIPSCGYVEDFDVEIHGEGFVILFPDKMNNFKMPNFTPRHNLARTFNEWGNYVDIMDVGTVAELNYHIEQGRQDLIIKVSEAFHEKKIARISDEICESGDKGKLILIAGPSSAGKTTTMGRLMIQLMTNGKVPLKISLDDYFINREDTPKDEHGEYDYENLHALDLELFNKNIEDLLNGFKAELPIYDFVTGMRKEEKKIIKPVKDQSIIVEGIHGINEELTYSLPRSAKYKIYISPMTQLNIDRHNRIPTSDIRKLRRMVRDERTRGIKPIDTFNRWDSIRRGEEKNIFPFQEEADAMFNSALVYELAVMRNYAEPLLMEIPKESNHYQEAQRLLTFLKSFARIDTSQHPVPGISILREFIG
jgi:uridine kinase